MNQRKDPLPSALAVHLHGRRIGTITRLAGDRNIFTFDDEHVENAERPVLSLSFYSPSGELNTNARTFATRLPPFFSNMLPEGHLRKYLANRAGVKPEREFFLLHILGADLPGAAQIKALGGGDEDNTPAANASDTEDGSRDRQALRFSLAGMQLKFSAMEEATGGLTIPAKGIGGQWIVKLPSMKLAAVPENEFVMMQLARQVGITVPPVRLVDVENIAGLPKDIGDLTGKALAVQRFDRLDDGTRVHIEDFAQIFGIYAQDKYEGHSYANIASVLSAACGEQSVSEFMARLTFSVLTGNADMHLKNWSLIYADQRTPALAPAYDLVATLPYLPNDRLGLSLGGSKDISTITREQIRRFADRSGLAANPLWLVVEETIERTVEAWRQHDAKALLPDNIRASVQQHIEKVAHNSLQQ